MARESKKEPLDRMQILLDDIRAKNTFESEIEESSVHAFHEIIRNLAQQNSNNMPPLLLTAEDRQQIQKDREKAIECEGRLAKRRQEKYFDLVDKVQNVLKFIEKKNSQKYKMTESGVCDISDIELSPVSSDCNNNPSPKQSEVPFFERTESFDSSCRSIKLSTGEGCSNQETSKQGITTRDNHNSSRYSLPSNFEDYHNCSYTASGYEVDIPVKKHHSQRRPVSVFSDHPSSYQNSSPLSEGREGSITMQTVVVQNKGFKTTWRGEAASGTPFDRSSSPGAINKQRESLLLEQKRLEDHFNTLQGKLLAEFQQQQNNLFEMYKGSVESQPESVAVETIVLNNSDKENYRTPGELPKSPFSLGPRKASNGGHKLTPNAGGVTVRSFNSEASLQEFYDITRFEVKASGAETVGQRKSRDERENEVVEGKYQVLQKSDGISSQNFGSDLFSSPKWTSHNSFESRTREIKDAENYKFFLVSAYAKGFITRLLFQTDKVASLITTLKDAKNVLNEMKSETSQSMTDRTLMERVKTQLQSAQSELCKIFLEVSPRGRMEIIQQNRKLLEEKQTRNENKVVSKVNAQSRPRLSNATMKKRLSRQQLQEKPLKSGKTATPSPSTVIKTTVRSNERTTPKNIAKTEKTKETSGVVTSTGKTTCVIKTRTSSVSKTSSVLKTVNSKCSSRVTKASSKNTVDPTKTTVDPTKTTVDPTKRRRTWDTGVLKPIQGRISPILPNKNRASGDKKQPISSLTARIIDQKVKTDHQARGTRGASKTAGNSRVNSKTFKVDNKQQHHVTRTGARRSLAANLSNK